MAVRLLTDEQMDIQVVHHLRSHGYDVLTVRETCESKYGDGIEDSAVLRYATAIQRVLITDNRSDFRRLHSEMGWHSGIVLCHVYQDAKKKADAIHTAISDAITVIPSGKLTGQLLRIPAESQL